MSTTSIKKSELLMPAGSLEKLKVAFLYGADAVYMGTPDLSMRTKSAFTLEEVVEGIEYAHNLNKRVYLTLNIFSHNKDIEKLPAFLEIINKVKPDGVIISDPGILQFVRQHAPKLPIHISTQANVCSWLSVQFWQEQGAELIVLAREVSFAELSEIRQKCPDVKLEAFVHGAMCMTYSGRCLLSNYMSERGANQGNCANSCRWNYTLKLQLKDGTSQELVINDDNRELFDFLLEEGCRPGELMPILEDEKGSYILNSKDLCLLPILNDYLALGIDSLKVEGRNKSLYYVGVVARAYRNAIDSWYNNPYDWDFKPYLEELHTVPNRGFSLAFHEGRLKSHSHNYLNTSSIGTYEFAGIIHDVQDDGLLFEVKNKIESGDVLEFVLPHVFENVLLRIYDFEEALKGKKLETVHGGLGVIIKLPFSLFHLEDINMLKQAIPKLTIVRKVRILNQVQETRMSYDQVSQKIELGIGNKEFATKKLQKLTHDLQNSSTQPIKSQIEKDSCCGKGCNGCLIFWNSPKYAKARKLLATKKQGQMLSNIESTDLLTQDH